MSQGREREAMAAEFTEQGWASHICASGEVIMDHIKHRPGPHILLMDTELSGSDTEQLLESLREMGGRIAILLVTDRHTANMAGVWAELGAWGYLLKPVSWARLWLYIDHIAEHFAALAERDLWRKVPLGKRDLLPPPAKAGKNQKMGRSSLHADCGADHLGDGFHSQREPGKRVSRRGEFERAPWITANSVSPPMTDCISTAAVGCPTAIRRPWWRWCTGSASTAGAIGPWASG